MTTMLIANNCTRENGQFMGDQLCYVKVAYLMVENDKPDKVIMSMSPRNEMHFLWQKFLDTYNVEVVYDNLDPGDNDSRWRLWDEWRQKRVIAGIPFDDYRELYLRIHGAQRQNILCGSERGLERKNIFEYVYYGQEHKPETCEGSDWYDDSLVYHPPLTREWDVYIAPHCKTQGNYTFTFDFWADVTRRLINAGVSVTLGYDGQFCQDLDGHPLFRRHWGSHEQWFEQVAKHRYVACGNTGTGWVSAACGVPLFTVEPHNSCMPDHRYRQCGLKNIVEVLDGFTLDSLNNDMSRAAEYLARQIVAKVKQVVVMTTGCYDVIHAGHVRHLEKSRALGTKLIVALNSDSSVRKLKGQSRPINNQDARRTVLEALRCVDEVRVFDEPDALSLVRELQPQVLTCGFGYTPESIVGRDLVESYGGRVLVTCTGDASTEPSTTKTVRQILRTGDIVEVCRVAVASSVNSFSKLMVLAEQLVTVADLHGDVADLGSYKGGAALVMRRVVPEKHLHLFDTWTGNPFDDELCHHKKGEWKADFAQCQQLVGINERTHYHQGVFPETVSGLDDATLCFVYVDADTYQSTQDAIAFFWPRLVYGGKMLFDDYNWVPCAGVKRAVDEAFTENQRQVIPSQYTCVVTKL